MKDLKKLNNLIGIDEDSTVDQFNEALTNLIADKAQAITDLGLANTAKKTAEDALQANTAAIDEIHDDVKTAEGTEAKVKVIKDKLAKKPGTANTKVDGEDPVEDGVDWETINALPHNKEADAALI